MWAIYASLRTRYNDLLTTYNLVTVACDLASTKCDQKKLTENINNTIPLNPPLCIYEHGNRENFTEHCYIN